MDSGLGVEEGIMEAPPVAEGLRWAVGRGGGILREGIAVNFDLLTMAFRVNDLRALPAMEFRRGSRRRHLCHSERR